MSTTSPVASHVAEFLSQSTRNSSKEDLPSSSVSDEETQFLGQNEKRDDVERAEKPPQKDKKKQEDRTQFFIWIVVNTLATIGIVRAHHWQLHRTVLTKAGLHKQGRLLRPQAPIESIDICRLSFHRHGADVVCRHKTVNRHVHVLSGELHQHDTTESRHVFERRPAESLTRVLIRGILSDRPGIADTADRDHQSAVLWH